MNNLDHYYYSSPVYFGHSNDHLQGVLYVGHLESKERLRIQRAQLFNFS